MNRKSMSSNGISVRESSLAMISISWFASLNENRAIRPLTGARTLVPFGLGAGCLVALVGFRHLQPFEAAL
jgi:hypothetical protein